VNRRENGAARAQAELGAKPSAFGGRLLLRAAERCMTVAQEVGGVALLIDTKSDHAAQWYESYGAARLLDATRSKKIGTIDCQERRSKLRPPPGRGSAHIRRSDPQSATAVLRLVRASNSRGPPEFPEQKPH
jgi:hypothetical protein